MVLMSTTAILSADCMNARILWMAIVGVAVIALGCGHKSKSPQVDVSEPPIAIAAPLAACREIPTNLSEDMRRLYGRICSTNISERFTALLDTPRPLPAEAANFLPLLAELMATDDFVASGSHHPGNKETDDYDKAQFGPHWAAGRRAYVSEGAAGVMASAGTNAIPFVIQALKSKKSMEVHAGLYSAWHLVVRLDAVGESKGLRAACIALLPYITMWTTNTLPETGKQDVAIYTGYGTIPGAASNTAVVFTGFLSSTESERGEGR